MLELHGERRLKSLRHGEHASAAYYGTSVSTSR